MFDNSNKEKDAYPSLLFLNGFVKNYDYTKTATGETSDFYTISPKLTLTNDTVEQYYLAGGRCYMYDFKYNDAFTTWGSYSTSQKGTATSWMLPYFSKDLYNLYNTDVQEWEPSPYVYASWNINYQSNIDSTYSLLETDFIHNPNFSYQKQFNSLSLVNENEYEINNFPVEDSNSRIYDLYWKDYLNEMYNRNTRDVTLYLDISKFGDANTILRKLYSWRSHLWIITKIENYKISDIIHDKFSKVTLHKIIDKNNWVN